MSASSLAGSIAAARRGDAPAGDARLDTAGNGERRVLMLDAIERGRGVKAVGVYEVVATGDRCRLGPASGLAKSSVIPEKVIAEAPSSPIIDSSPSSNVRSMIPP